MNMSILLVILTSTPIDWCVCGLVCLSVGVISLVRSRWRDVVGEKSVGVKSLVWSRWCEVVGVQSLV